jgi:hypothetical protein
LIVYEWIALKAVSDPQDARLSAWAFILSFRRMKTMDGTVVSGLLRMFFGVEDLGETDAAVEPPVPAKRKLYPWRVGKDADLNTLLELPVTLPSGEACFRIRVRAYADRIQRYSEHDPELGQLPWVWDTLEEATNECEYSYDTITNYLKGINQ